MAFSSVIIDIIQKVNEYFLQIIQSDKNLYVKQISYKDRNSDVKSFNYRH